MFTGIVQFTGKIAGKVPREDLVEFEIAMRPVEARPLKLGSSLCVNGVCLTVARKTRRGISVQAVRETLAVTNLGALKRGDLVNLEPALRAADFLGGHLVTGHVDALGVLEKMTRREESLTLKIKAPVNIMQYIIPKGSVAVDGISLTVQNHDRTGFEIAIIPHTLKHTNLRVKKEGDQVNLEADQIAKYMKKYVDEGLNERRARSESRLTEEYLKGQGY
ncbi:MAG: riboflavin synthase [Candidatus Omnitrophica bacterium]|nr:riboflavin synthase [Candidatus Omnitrophota bacterium]